MYIALRGGWADTQRYRYRVDEREGRLSGREAELLARMAERPGRDLSRDELLTEVLGYNPNVVTRALDLVVLRLRKKIERDPTNPNHILTVPRVGYRFEPLQTPGRPVSELVGRDRDLQDLLDELGPGRIVTLCGGPGVGKSALAVEVQGIRARAGARVARVGLRDATDLQGWLGEQLGFADLVTGLRSLDLIVLDDADLSSALAQQLPTWASRAPGLCWLVVGRAPLFVVEEQLITLEPLAPDDTLELLRRQVPAGVDPTALAPLTEGVPGAAVLLARQLRMLGAEEVVRRWEGGASGLGSSVERSWELVPPGARAVLGALCVFAAAVEVTVVERIAGVPDALAGLDVLERLGLIQVLPTDPPTVLAYRATREFPGATPPDEVTERLAEWAAERCGALLSEVRDLGRPWLLAHRALLETLVAREDSRSPVMGAALLWGVGALSPRAEGHLEASLHLAEPELQATIRALRMLRGLEELDVEGLEPHLEVPMVALAVSASLQARGEFDRAASLAQRVAPRAPLPLAVTLGLCEAACHLERLDPDAAVDAYRRVLMWARRTGNPELEAVGRAGLAGVEAERGRLDTAISLTRQALTLLPEGSPLSRRANLLTNLSALASAGLELDVARAAAEEACSLLRRIGEPIQLARALCCLADLERIDERPDEAILLLLEAVDLSAEQGQDWLADNIRMQIAAAFGDLGELQQAEEQLALAEAGSALLPVLRAIATIELDLARASSGEVGAEERARAGLRALAEQGLDRSVNAQGALVVLRARGWWSPPS